MSESWAGKESIRIIKTDDEGNDNKHGGKNKALCDSITVPILTYK